MITREMLKHRPPYVVNVKDLEPGMRVRVMDRDEITDEDREVRLVKKSPSTSGIYTLFSENMERFCGRTFEVKTISGDCIQLKNIHGDGSEPIVMFGFIDKWLRYC